jgi:tetratricopeptide (TPR) repeat protein
MERIVDMKILKKIGWVFILALSICIAYPMQDPSILLEKAIYTEETLGNLQDAIALYQQIVAVTDAGRTTAALALYRLGMCYQKSGRTEEAQTAFAKLTRLYPEQKDLIAKIPALSAAPKFRSAPWEDGELLQYSMLTKGSGSNIGFHIYTIELMHEAGKTEWKFRAINGMTGPSETITVRMDARYAPIEDRKNGSEQEPLIYYNFSPDRVVISRKLGGATKPSEHRLNRPVYDGEQIPYLLRLLPLQEGYKTTLPIISGNGAILDIKVAVESREKITVPAGTFNCFKISTKSETEERTYWLAIDNYFYPVKVNASNTIDLVLESVSKSTKNTASGYTSEDRSLSITVPPGWLNVPSKLMGLTILNLIDPENETTCYLGITKLPEPAKDINANLSRAVDQLSSMYAPQYKDFQIRPGSRLTSTLNGLPMIQFIADHKALISGRDSVMYAFIFGNPNKIGQIYFKTTRDNFEKWRPFFDSIVHSIQLK